MAAGCEGSAPRTLGERTVGEEGERFKPFTPEKAKEIVMSLQQPAVFCNMVFDWPSRHWTAKHLSEVLEGKQIRFRMGLRGTGTVWPAEVFPLQKVKRQIDQVEGLDDMLLLVRVPQFETECSYVDATLEEFLTWNCDQSSVSGPFKDYDHSKFWAYADYKYFVTLFEDKPDVFQEVVWSDFGFPGRNGQESTLWIGSLGAHTPCHLDSYGCNLVFQVQGRKRWHLFPPEDTPFLYPTRIPYEESSVFSKINVVNPDLKRFPQFRKARRHMVTLSPGQVLFVPRHWWHYVESLDPVTVSINSWIELEEDHLARVEEAVTRMLVCTLKTAEDPHHPRTWLNPTEVEETSHEVNSCYLNSAVCAFFDHCKKSKEAEMQTLRAAGEEPSVQEHMEVEQTPGPCLTAGAGTQEAASLFGPDLVPVTLASEERVGALEGDSEESISSNGVHLADLPCARRQQTSKGASAEAEPSALRSPVAPSRIFVSTDDLLDCLVNPQVTRMVAQLLIQGKSL